MPRLHRNAAVRCLRTEHQRLEDARLLLTRSIDDLRFGPNVILSQIEQCEDEQAELLAAIAILMRSEAPTQGQLPFDRDAAPQPCATGARV